MHACCRYSVKNFILSSLVGAFVVSFLATFQFIHLVGRIAPELYILPVFVGAISGFVISYWLQRFSLANQKIQQEKATLELVLEGSNLGVWDWYPQTNKVAFDERWCQLLGYELSEIAPSYEAWQSRVHPDDLEQCLQEIQNHFDNKTAFFSGMFRMKHKQGHWVYILAKGRIVERDAQGKPLHFTGTHSDISYLKDLEAGLAQKNKQLEQLPLVDRLTGLGNRVALQKQFVVAKKLADQQQTMIAVCIIDIDDFKHINEQMGNKMGDLLLVETAQRLSQFLHQEGYVSRLSGDEFAFLVCGLENQQQIINCIQRLLQAFEQPFEINHHRIVITGGIGVALYPDVSDEFDVLTRDADHAMYLAKQKGKNQFVIYDQVVEVEQQQFNALVQEVRNGLLNQEFVLHYQPKVDMRSGKILGMEALLRWQHPKLGIRPPLSYLPAIEQHDIIVELGDWVLETALAQIEHWHSQGKNWGVSVNIASHQLQQESFFIKLKNALDRHPDAPAHLLELEVLETVVLSDLEYVDQLINRCHELGIKVALDDFGTGYSSLSYLKKLNTETIKVDQSFVRDMTIDPGDMAIIEAIISMGKAFGRQVLAEGVETDEQGIILMRLGCGLAQGYGIAKPMPADEVIGWAQTYQASTLWQRWNHQNWQINDLPLIMAQHDHIQWINQLEGYIQAGAYDNDSEKRLEVQSHHHCRFGQWYYGIGKRYAETPAYLAIEEPHKQVHVLGIQVVDAVAVGDIELARQKLAMIYPLRDKILTDLAQLQGIAVLDSMITENQPIV